MASISDLPHGRRKIQFSDSSGKRQTVYLGKVSHRHAEGWQLRIEQLVIAQRLQQQPEDDVSKWLAKLSDAMHAKLSRTGLIPPRASGTPEAVTLGPWVERYITGRSDAKATTAVHWRVASNRMLAFFGAGRRLTSITTADAIDFRLWMLAKCPEGRGLSDNTVRRTIGIAKQFLQRAVKAKLIADNPFKDEELPTSTTDNKTREHFITRDEAAKVLAACPDPEWRLIFAMSRYGGLRCPSEHGLLRWGDVDWERNRVTITAPKTEHHAGKGVRVIPLFPELREHLQAAYDAAPEGAEWIMPRCRQSAVNLRTQLQRIIKRAGLAEWPKLFHNLRASRQTELAATYPIHVVCAWLGNSPAIAMRHYLQVRDSDYEKAASEIERNVEHPVHSPSVPECPGATAEVRKRPRNSIKPQKPAKTGWAMRDTNCMRISRTKCHVSNRAQEVILSP